MQKRISVLLVVLILMIGGGLVAVAVQKVRHAAARMQCANNLKQMGVALHSYHSASGKFPPATIVGEGQPYLPGLVVVGTELPPEHRLSYLVDLVPYLEQLFLTIDRKKAWDDEANIEPRFPRDVDDKTSVERPLGEWQMVRCPQNLSAAGPRSPGLTHDVGIAGVGAKAADALEGAPGIGVFGHERQTRTEDIKDGLGSTLMVVETTFRNGPWTAGGYPTVRGLDPSGPYLGVGGQFGSEHFGGITQAIFADGSVRCLTASLSPTVFEALATIAGGEEVGPFAD